VSRSRIGRALVCAVFVGASVAGCRSAGSSAAVPPGPPSGDTVTTRRERLGTLTEFVPGDLMPWQLSALAPRVGGLSAAPAELRISAGDTIRLGAGLRVTVVDSAGNSLGRILTYDVALEPGAAVLALDPAAGIAVAGRSPGESALRISFPAEPWRPRTDPRPELSIPVRVQARP
jgi:hypothetical protein